MKSKPKFASLQETIDHYKSAYELDLWNAGKTLHDMWTYHEDGVRHNELLERAYDNYRCYVAAKTIFDLELSRAGKETAKKHKKLMRRLK